MPEPISNFIFNLVNSQWFYYILGFWTLIAIARRDERNSFASRLADLISKPAIFEADENPQSVSFYPRKSMEKIATDVRKALIRIPNDINAALEKAIKNQLDFIVDPQRRWKLLGYAIYVIFMFFFLWADGIAIANALDALGLVATVPSYLTLYEIAVAVGSFLAIIVGALVARDVFNAVSDFSDWDTQQGAWKKLAKVLAILLIISGLLVAVVLGLGRFQRLVSLPVNIADLINLGVNFTTLVLVPFNTLIATILIHFEAFKGLLLVFVLIEAILWVPVRILQYVAEILGAMGPFSVDILYRFLLAILIIIIFWLLTPLDWITSLIPRRK